MNRSQIEAMPNDPVKLKLEIIRLHDIVDSHEAAKRQRAQEAAVTSSSPAASFELDVFGTKAELEGLSDGSEDYTDPNRRGLICRGAIRLIDAMFAALPRS